MRLNWVWMLLVGCKKPEPQSTPSKCLDWTREEGDDGVLIELERPDADNVKVQAIIPTTARSEEGAPTAVFVHGTWSPKQIPLANNSVSLRRDLGFTTLYPNLGRPDARGANSRAVLARVLQYANGEITDTDNCSLDSRIPDGRAPEIALAGFSNGGNLVWATAADTELGIQRIDGIATFETPSASQMVLGETGTQRKPNPRFEVDECSMENGGLLRCEIDYSPIRLGPTNGCQSSRECLFMDLDHSASWTNGDVQLGHVIDPTTDKIAYSTPVTIAAEAIGVLPDRAYRRGEVENFWSWREATALVGAAADQFPMLAGIATGTETDHVLDDLDRPIHILGLIQAMEENGIHWARLHPDATFLDEIAGSAAAWEDVPANSGVSIDDDEWRMEPEDGVHIRGTDYLSAAVAEILDRSRTQDWSNDI